MDDLTYMKTLIKSLKELIEQRMSDVDKATVLQHIEMLRRLDMLNHSQERADRTQNTYLPREIFEKSQEEMRSWRAQIDAAVTRAAERKAVYASVAFSVLTLMGVIVTTVMRIFGK